MDAALGLEEAVRVLALDGDRRRLEARLLPGARLDELGLEAAVGRPAEVHPEQHLGPVLRVGAARAGGDRDDRVPGVVLAVEERLLLQARQLGADRGELLGDLVLERRVELEELRRLVDLARAGARSGRACASRGSAPSRCGPPSPGRPRSPARPSRPRARRGGTSAHRGQRYSRTQASWAPSSASCSATGLSSVTAIGAIVAACPQETAGAPISRCLPRVVLVPDATPESSALVPCEIAVADAEMVEHELPPLPGGRDLAASGVLPRALAVDAAAQDVDALADAALHRYRRREARARREERVHRFEVVDRCFLRRDVEAAEAAAGLVLEAPRAVAEGRRPEPVHGVALDVLAGHERERLSRPVAEPDVDEPRSRRRRLSRSPRGGSRPRREAPAPARRRPGEVPRDVDAEPGEQRGERAVQVEQYPHGRRGSAARTRAGRSRRPALTMSTSRRGLARGGRAEAAAARRDRRRPDPDRGRAARGTRARRPPAAARRRHCHRGSLPPTRLRAVAALELLAASRTSTGRCGRRRGAR